MQQQYLLEKYKNKVKEKNSWTLREADIPRLVDELKIFLSADESSFCLWLLGDMGAGKTTFCRYFLQGLGLDKRIPVSSPTFSYMNEYKIGSSVFLHMDLYRVENTDFFEEMFSFYEGKYDGMLIEWPGVALEQDSFVPTDILTIERVIDKNEESRISRCCYTLYQLK